MHSWFPCLLSSIALFLTLGVAVPAAETEVPTQEELEARVPALTRFHEVIYQLWHHAWPEKDFELMKELLPRVQDHVREVKGAELPGILRDKKEEWAEGVRALEGTLKEYEQAAARDDGASLLAAVEKIHSRFEDLMRIIHPVMPELDAYHRVLYGIFHYHMPERNRDQLVRASRELVSRCQALSEAPIPVRLGAKAKALAPEIKTLCERSDEVQAVAGEQEWSSIEAAVERVHSQYLEVEGMFH